MIDLRELRYFQAVALTGSYSRGSELLHISQPAVSRAIHNLEAQLGVELFKRHGRGVQLTSAGQTLITRTQSLFKQVEQLGSDLREGGAPSGTINFAVPPAAGSVLVPHLLSVFSTSFPNVVVNIVGGYSGRIHEWLIRGQVDLACLHDPIAQKGFDILPLINETVFLVGKGSSSLAKRKYVTRDDLATLPLILPSRSNAARRLVERWNTRPHAALNVRFEVDDHSITRSLVYSGAGYTLLTHGALDEEARRKGILALPFRPSAHWPLSLVTFSHHSQPGFVAEFIKTLRLVTKQLVAAKKWRGTLLDA